MSDLSRFDSDPEALAWARAKVQRVIDQANEFERQVMESADVARIGHWRRVAYFMDSRLVGDGTGCIITAFDERRPLDGGAA